jgi:hypothetical protein
MEEASNIAKRYGITHVTGLADDDDSVNLALATCGAFGLLKRKYETG